MWLGQVDPFDETALRAFWEVGRAADTHDREYSTYWQWPVARSVLQRPTGSRMQLIAAFDGEEMVGTCELTLPLRDNTHFAEAELMVRPPARRRGIGSALLARAVDTARAAGRRVLMIEAFRPMEGGPSPGWRFLLEHGFSADTAELHRVAPLPVDEAVLADLAEEAAAHHSAYRLVQWGNRMPQEYVESYCALMTTFNDEAPTGDLDVEPELYDQQRIREREAKFDEQGRAWYTTASVAADGEMAGDVVGVTEMCISADDPTWGWQDETLVAPCARGHRLGLAMKVANLRRFQADQPRATAVHSWNAEVNARMVAINDQLGFRPVERSSEMQLHLT